MNVEIFESYEAVSERAKQLVVKCIKAHKRPVLGLATGSTPLALYQNLIHAYKSKEISFNHVVTYNLDEYIGIDQNHPQSYYQFMRENLFDHVDIQNENIHMPNNDKTKLDTIAQSYTNDLEKNHIDLQILGIGKNGHIGFNEPGTPLGQETFIVKLDEQTRKDNSRFFESLDAVPTHAITMGIKNIMHAQSIVLIASGEDKAEAVYQAVHGPVCEELPASVLQLHPNCTFILDKEAAKLL